MPIDQKEFKASIIDLEKEIMAFLSRHSGKAYTSDEIMNATSLQTSFDLQVAPKISVFIVANFVAIINDLASEGKIRRKVVNNRMYFMAVNNV